jgi:hypothetical protein
MHIDRIHFHLRRHDWVGTGLVNGQRRAMVYLSDAVMTNATFKHASPSAHARIQETVREVCMWVSGTVATTAKLHQSAKGASDAGTYQIEHSGYALLHTSLTPFIDDKAWKRIYCNPKKRSRFFTYTNDSGVECIAHSATRVYFADSGRCYAFEVNGSPLRQSPQ